MFENIKLGTKIVRGTKKQGMAASSHKAIKTINPPKKPQKPGGILSLPMIQKKYGRTR